MHKKILLMAILNMGQAWASSFSLSDYLAEIKEKNEEHLGAVKSEQAAVLGEKEGDLFFAPHLLLQSDYSRDKRLTNSPGFQGKETIVKSQQVGILKKFSQGLDAKLTYQIARTEIVGADPLLLRFYDYADTRPQLQLSQSLWRNFWGQEWRALSQSQNAQREAAKWSNAFNQKNILGKAELVYWSLATARETMAVRKSSLDRALQLLAIAQKKYNNQLIDRIDVLQSEAALKSNQLEYDMAKQNVKTFSRAFNLARAKEGDEVTEELDSLSDIQFETITLSSVAPERDDLKAARARALSFEKQAQLGLEANKPLFDIYGTFSYNGKSNQTSNAINEGLKDNYTQNAIGVRFVAPLDFSLINNNSSGHRLNQIASLIDLRRKEFEQKREWEDLVQRYQDSLERVKLANAIMQVQKEKVLYERGRWTKGRSTIFQVLIFEQDYSESMIAKWQSILQALSLSSQIKLFRS